MNKLLVEAVRRRVCSVMEEIGGVCTRLRELEEEIPCNAEDQWDDVVSWLTGASEEMREAALRVESVRDGVEYPGSSIFELVDVTSEENYYTMGVFWTLEDAVKVASKGEGPPRMEIEDNLVLLEIRERTIEKLGWSQTGEVRAKIRWEQKFSDDDEDAGGKWRVSLSE